MDLREIFNQISARIVQASNAELVMIPKGMAVYETERLQKEPDRHRALYQTHDLLAFGHYCHSHADGRMTAYVNVDLMECCAVLNPGSRVEPSWSDDVAIFRPKLSPLMDAAMKLTGSGGARVGQSRLIEFCEDWREQLTFSRDGKDIPAAQAIKLFADLSVEQIRTDRANKTQAFDRQRSATESISIKSGVPDRLTLGAPFYIGLGEYEVNITLEAAVVDGEPGVRARIIGLPAIEQQVKDAMADKIAAALPQEAEVYAGSWSFRVTPVESVVG